MAFRAVIMPGGLAESQQRRLSVALIKTPKEERAPVCGAEEVLMKVDARMPKVRDITMRFTVTEDGDGPTIGSLIEPWPDFLVGIQVLRENKPRNATAKEAKSMCWRM